MNWLKQLFARRRMNDDMSEEIQEHLAEKIEELVAEGMSRKDATAAARRAFGNVSLTEEDSREVWRWTALEDFLMDVRHGLRVLRKNPGFTAAAVTVLALGIGANTALFSVVYGVLLRPLPFAHPEQLVALRESKPNFATGSISYPNFLDWQKDNRSFASMALMRSGRSFILTGMGEAEQLDGVFISTGFFEQLGVNPIIGQTFAAGTDRIGAAPTAMITTRLWRRKFGSSKEVIGKGLVLDGKEYSIVGVIPPKFDLMGMLRTQDVYLPIGQWNNPILMNRTAGLGIGGIGRLKPGVNVEQARADMKRVTDNLAAAYPEADKGIGAAVIPLRKWSLGNVGSILFVLFGAVGFVLLIACVNVANLMLARSNRRAHEFAIRGALGAGQGRIVRQLLTESSLVALIGGGVGVVLAAVGTQAALRLLPTTLPRASEVGMDGYVLTFAAVISLAAGILFGLAPALKTARSAPQEMLKEGGRGLGGTRHFGQGALVAAEVALALILLIGAGLMLRTLGALWKVDPGFEASKALSFGFSLPPTLMDKSAEATRSSLREVQNRFAAVPGVQGVAFSWGATPLIADDEWLFWIDGQPKPASENEMNWALSYVVGEDYRKIMGIPLISGRFFTALDNEHAQPVAVIDDVLANKYFPGQNAIGQRLHVNNIEQAVEIVGVVGHVKQWGLDTDDTETLRAQLYTPFMQLPDKAMALSGSGLGVMVRSDNPAKVFASIRAANREMSSEQVIYGVQTMNEVIAESLGEKRFSMILLGVFAGLALLLAGVGIYGVVSYIAGRRTQEIGIRMALGAQSSDVLRMVLGEGARMTAVGVMIGLLAALGLTRLMANLLFGVSATDPITFVIVSAVLALVALSACYIPARRATRIDPMAALRFE